MAKVHGGATPIRGRALHSRSLVQGLSWAVFRVLAAWRPLSMALCNPTPASSSAPPKLCQSGALGLAAGHSDTRRRFIKHSAGVCDSQQIPTSRFVSAAPRITPQTTPRQQHCCTLPCCLKTIGASQRLRIVISWAQCPGSPDQQQQQYLLGIPGHAMWMAIEFDNL